MVWLGDVPVDQLIDNAKKRKLFVFDVETTGLSPRKDRLTGISFYVPEDKSQGLEETRVWYPFIKGTVELTEMDCNDCRHHFVPSFGPLPRNCPLCSSRALSAKTEDKRDPVDQTKTMGALRELFDDRDLVALAQNIKFDAAFLDKASGLEKGIQIRCRWADSMVAVYAGDEELKKTVGYGLKKLVYYTFGHEMTTFEDAVKQGRLPMEASRPLGCYAMEDTYWTWRLFWWAYCRLAKQDKSGNLLKLFWEVDMPLAQIITEMETTGVLVDVPYMETVWERLEKEKNELYDTTVSMIANRTNPFIESARELTEGNKGAQRGMFGDSFINTGRKGKAKSLIRSWDVDPPNFNSTTDVSRLLFAAECEGGLGLESRWIDEEVYGKSGAKRDKFGLIGEDRKNAPLFLDVDEEDREFEPLQDDEHTTSTRLIARFRKDEPIVENIIEWRSLDTIQKSFATKILKLMESQGGDHRLYTSFNQVATTIARLSSSGDINMQNQPNDKDLIRKAYCTVWQSEHEEARRLEQIQFEARQHGVLGKIAPELLVMRLFGCDYDQIEMKIAACQTKDPVLLEVYGRAGICDQGRYGCETFQNNKGKCRHADIHQRTSEDVGVERSTAKALNFGMMYRMAAKTFCANCAKAKADGDFYGRGGKPNVQVAQGMIDRWFETYCGVRLFHEKHAKLLPARNYHSFTRYGRRRRLRECYKDNEYKAITQSIQFEISGTAQDLMKAAMIRMWRMFQQKVREATDPVERFLWSQVKMLLQIHDEVILQGPSVIEKEIRQIVEWAMTMVDPTLEVPLTAECKSGFNWDEIK